MPIADIGMYQRSPGDAISNLLLRQQNQATPENWGDFFLAAKNRVISFLMKSMSRYKLTQHGLCIIIVYADNH